MKKLIKIGFVMLPIYFLVVFLTTNYANTSNHEKVHERIYKNHGCNDVTLKISLFGESFAQCEDRDDVPEQMTSNEELLHSVNEIITYNLMTVNQMIFLCSIGLCLTILFVGVIK